MILSAAKKKMSKQKKKRKNANEKAFGIKDQNDSGENDEKSDEASELDTQSQHRLKKASKALNEAQADAALPKTVAKVGGAAIASATSSATKLARKKPVEMSADELQKAIDGVDAAIGDGKILLPADAGILARALAVLKKALIELGGGSLSIKNKGELEDLVDQKRKKESGDSETSNAELPTGEMAKQKQVEVAKAVEGVRQAQQQVAYNRQQRGEPTADPNNETLKTVKRIDADNLDAEGMAKALDDVEKAIAEGKTLAPEGGSLLQRMLFALKKALFDLAGVEFKQEITNKEELLDLIQSKSNNTSDNEPKDETNSPERAAKINRVKSAIEDVKEAEAHIARQQQTEGPIGGVAVQGALKAISETPPEKMTEQQLHDAIKAVDDALEKNKVMLSADTGLLTRLLYILKQALFSLGGADPEWEYEDRQKWVDKLDSLQREQEKEREQVHNNTELNAEADSDKSEVDAADDDINHEQDSTSDQDTLSSQAEDIDKLPAQDNSPLINPDYKQVSAFNDALVDVTREQQRLKLSYPDWH
ncbi:hypothetical protein [Zooshikella ganghwensis]|uniref:hypothetical protein n=1 Tax=Zooshikella ganghwensis TaxID=202772 RepID=UPI0004025F66|nr:hypothetical protein [Zooshikella ganghwensis]